MDYIIKTTDGLYLAHHGILGMKWGIRRFQNEDGTLTAKGKKRYSGKLEEFQDKKGNKYYMAKLNDKATNYENVEKNFRKSMGDKEKNLTGESIRYDILNKRGRQIGEMYFEKYGNIAYGEWFELYNNGHGVGGNAFKKGEELVKKHGADKLALDVFENNKATGGAKHIYEKNGYKQKEFTKERKAMSIWEIEDDNPTGFFGKYKQKKTGKHVYMEKDL